MKQITIDVPDKIWKQVQHRAIPQREWLLSAIKEKLRAKGREQKYLKTRKGKKKHRDLERARRARDKDRINAYMWARRHGYI